MLLLSFVVAQMVFGIAHQRLRSGLGKYYLVMPVSTWRRLREVAQVMRHHPYQTSLGHGCTALSQLQQVMLVSDQADHDSLIALLTVAG